MKPAKAIFSAMLTVLSLVTVPVNTTAAVTASSVTKVAVPGSQAVAALHGHLLAHKNAQDVVSVTLTLNLHNKSQIDSFIADLYNPASPNYKKFLTPQQFTAQFGPTAADVQQVKDFATANGLQVTNVATSNQAVTVSGTVAQMESAFGVRINNYVNARGQKYFANTNTPTVPSEIAGVINGVVGLDNEPKFVAHAVHNPAPTPTVTANVASPHTSPYGGYTPAGLQSAYDITPLANAGYDGTGQNIALVEFDGYDPSNITAYDQQFGLGSPAPQNVLINGYSGSIQTTNGEGEVELDIEVLNAIAPKAQVMVYEAPNDSLSMLDMYQQIADDNTAKTVSTSWGMCEQDNDYNSLVALHNILAQMAMQGQSVFAAAGDSGAYDCSDVHTLSVDYPASDPYVTGVGGTNLSVSNDTYDSESAWSDTWNEYGGGGGISSYFRKPTWQIGSGVINNGRRQVPDVSADADPASGYAIYSAGQWGEFGGTSAATPLWAGIAALNNQYAEAAGQADLGQANPTLYQMFNTRQSYPAYHDVLIGNNLYYHAHAGYDQATGIGTPDAYNLIRDINSGGLAIVANATKLTSGQNEAISAMSTVNGRTTNVTSHVTWSSSDDTIAYVSSGILHTGLPGTATLTATINNATTTFEITVLPRLTGLSIGSNTMQMHVGDTNQLAAIATYNDGTSPDVTSSVKWTSSNSRILTVDANGVMTAKARGSVTVIGRYSGQNVTLTITVTPVLTGITVTPSTATVTLGAAPLRVTVTALYNDGMNAIVTQQATITSTSGLVHVLSNGFISGIAKGSDTLNVTYNGQTAQVALNVVPPLQSIQVPPSLQQLAVGNTQVMSVTATYRDGSSADVTSAITWTSSNPSVASVDSNGTVTAHKRGSVRISGVYMGRSIGSNFTVIPVLTNITATISSSTIRVGRAANVSVTANYNDGINVGVSYQARITSANGFVTISRYTIIGKTAGQDTLTITYGGQTATIPVTITTI